MKKLEVSFEINPNILGIKSPTFWLHSEKNSSSPLAYIRKPRGAKKEEFKALITYLNYIFKRIED